MAHKILVIEDDVSFGLMLKNWFHKNGFESTLCQSIESAKKEIRKIDFTLVLSDLRLPDGDGVMFLSWLREQKSDIPLIIMTSYGELQSAIASIKLGAEDYLQKPINPAILKEKIESIIESRKHKAPEQVKTSTQNNNIVILEGKSAIAKQMYRYIDLVANTQLSVLLLGESGTGKEFAARSIHIKSSRKDKPYIAVDCGSLSKELAPSELFGHLKGSFTSAISDKKGVFEQANGGTIFLDEVGNLSYDVQVQLLRALQERRIRPVGSAKDIEVDVRIIAATNENIEEAIAKGDFRQDLYHRLNELSIIVPPLRKRNGDIEIFANHFLQMSNEELNKNVTEISPEAMDILNQYEWPGNIRELRNVVRRAALFAESQAIRPENLPVLTKTVSSDFVSIKDSEKERIEEALLRANGNKSLAAQLLGVDRKTLYNKIAKYGI